MSGMKIDVRAALAVLALAPAATHAQTNVTLFGTVDTGIEYRTHTGAAPGVQVTSGLQYASAIGVRGSEDLGGGLSAIFRLESGFAPDTGVLQQGGRLFGRQAWIGLASQHDRIVLGRVYTPLYDVIGYLDPMLGANVSLWTMDGGMVSRMDKAVRYTRTEGPLHLNAQYSFGSDTLGVPVNGTAGGGARSREAALAVDYTTPQFMAGIVYDRIRGPMTSAQYGFSLYVPSLVPSAPVTPERVERLAAAVRATWNDTSLFAGMRRLEARVQASDRASNLYWTGLSRRATPRLTATIGAYYQKVAGLDASARLLALQTQYRFSKQTGLFANAGKVWNSRLTNMGVDLQTQTLQGATQLAVSTGLFYFF
jgi:predicted porin